MRLQPLICVRDVEASSCWYQRLLGCQSAHGGPDYERLVWHDGLIHQMHRLDVEHHHGCIGDPNISHTEMACSFGLNSTSSAPLLHVPERSKLRSSNPAMAARMPTGNAGCVILKAT